MPAAAERLDRAAAAAVLGIAPKSLTAGVRRGTYPEPDGHVGRSPWWYPATLDAHRAGEQPPAPPRGRAVKLDRAAVAGRYGIAPDSVTRLVHRGDLPAPDGHLGRSPWWYAETLDGHQRPGRTGRPRKSAES